MGSDHELRVHRDWIGALQPVGLLVSAPALVRAQAFPDQNTLEKRAALVALVKPRRPGETEREYEKRKPSAVRFQALAEGVLGWKAGKLVEPPEGLSVVLPAFHETLRATWAVRALPEDEGEWMMLVQELPEGAGFDEAPGESSKRWHASPQVRLERLLKESGVPIGILTNGGALRLVYAPRGESSGHATWPLAALTQASHKEGLAALCMLLGAARLFALGKGQRLPDILRESRKYQNVVSTKLAGQVLEALNELLRGFQAADEKAKGGVLERVVRDKSEHVYGGLLAVLLRLVFVLYAEERGMLSASAVYVRNYSLVGLFEKLRLDQGRFPDTMDDRYGAWSRLLVLFRMIYDGAKRGDLVLPARYGHLFDPDGWGFLEGRPYGVGRVKDAPVDVPKVADGVVYRVLDKLLMLDGERLSYRALDVEQIGSVYENMMGFRVESATETCIGVGKDHVVVGLDTLLGKKGGERDKYLKEAAGVELSGKAGEALKKAASMDDLVAALSRRISPLTPRTIPAGGIYLQPTEERRRSGSHYTPRELTEPIVRTTLRPVLEALGESPTPESLLALKVCDPAMGSGAFLVEACRQLGSALVVAWQEHHKIPEIPPDEDQELHARRLIAQKCIYGVDKNPFAVELAKLSIWLVTLAKEHPLTFVDHALREGDSLVGLSSEQIYNLAFDMAKGSKVAPQARNTLLNKVRQAETLRGQLHDLGDSDNTVEKRRLLREADDALDDVRLMGDAMVASFFLHRSDKERKKALENLVAKVPAWVQKRDFDGELRDMVGELRGGGDTPLVPFHWEIEFPEVYSRSRPGFDCIVGNPPFAGKNTISRTSGDAYIHWLMASYEGAHGNADLSAYFFRRAATAIGENGSFGLIATNTIAQGDTRSTGLQSILKHGGEIYAAQRSMPWPGEAAVFVSTVHVAKGCVVGSRVLDGSRVAAIDSRLQPRVECPDPVSLVESSNMGFAGAKLFGQGFVLSEEERRKLIEQDPKNGVHIQRYIGGEEVNTLPAVEPERYVINFGHLDLKQAEMWPDLVMIARERVKPERESNKRGTYQTYWWRLGETGTAMYAALTGKRRCLVACQVSRHICFAWQRTDVLFAHTLCVFAIDDDARFACVQSRIHEYWARLLSSSMKDDLRYTPSDCFETFPFPPAWADSPTLEAAGQTYYDFRAALMIRNNEGLTKTYNRFHDPDETDPDILQLRDLHAAMDRAVLDAYGWTDLHPTSEFLLDYEDPDDEDPDDAATPRRKKKKPWRYRWPDDLRDEVLARLLALNAQRAGEEAAAAALPPSADTPKSPPKRAKKPPKTQRDLFGNDDKQNK